MWLMNGVAPSSAAIILSDPNWAVTYTADTSGDGMTDLIWRNSVTGQTGIWLMNGAVATATGLLLSDVNWQVKNPGGKP